MVAWHRPCFKQGMNSGFYNAAIQMSTGSVQDMEVHTENLANSTMPGYKRLESSHAAFANVLDDQVGQRPEAAPITVNHTQGALRATGRSLDFAIEGNGFFVVSDGQQEFYTRNGGFRVSPDGTIVNSLGMPVQTTAGDLRIPTKFTAAQLEIDDKMNLRVGGKVIGQLRIAAVEDVSLLQQAGTTLFINNNDVPETDPECKVMNGFLEQSNTGIFEEMVGMMTTLRNYEACQKMLRTVDDVEKQMMSKLA